jgi:DNA-nicking Smr family endonuclease
MGGDGTGSEEARLFREAMADAQPIRSVAIAPRGAPRPKPMPFQTLADERAALADSLSDAIPWDAETGEELRFLRDGLRHDILRKLRRGHWVVQAGLDLHGMNRMEARVALAEFLHGCVHAGLRCVRIVHGKGLGSPNREPVLKHLTRVWLMRREEVLAFCEAPPAHGGAGAALVLLRSPRG